MGFYVRSEVRGVTIDTPTQTPRATHGQSAVGCKKNPSLYGSHGLYTGSCDPRKSYIRLKVPVLRAEIQELKVHPDVQHCYCQGCVRWVYDTLEMTVGRRTVCRVDSFENVQYMRKSNIVIVKDVASGGFVVHPTTHMRTLNDDRLGGVALTPC